jgi:phosphoenolpyruvate carboxykinase (ATP)
MLGETSKTSAAGKERGRTRSPFTQPFFPQRMGLQAERFSKLAEVLGDDVVMWLMNTGYIGGDAHDETEGKALKVKIRHSSAMLEAMLKGDIKWKDDPDFGYQIVDVDAPENSELIEKVPVEILNPVLFYKKHNKMDIYKDWVKGLHKERLEFLTSYGVDENIIKSVCR